VCSIFLELVSLSVLPIYTKCLQATNSVNEFWFSAIRKMPRMCWILNCWRQCLAVRYLDRAILQAVTVEVARAPVFFTELSTWNRLSSVFWRAEILTNYCAAGIRFWAKVLFLYLLKDYFLIRAAASPAVTVGHYPSMNETSRSRAYDGGWSSREVGNA
jgi:hypothetical protein